MFHAEFMYKAPEANLTHTCHTTHKGKMITLLSMGGAFGAAPIGTVVFPFVCGANVGGLLCGTSIESIESIKSIESIESVESVVSSDSIESIESKEFIEPIESIELCESHTYLFYLGAGISENFDRS